MSGDGDQGNRQLEPGAEWVRRVADAVEVLEEIRTDRTVLLALDPELRQRLLMMAGQVARPGPWAKKKLARAARRLHREQTRAADEAVLQRTGIRHKRRDKVFTTPRLRSAPVLAGDDIDPERVEESMREARKCYVCKKHFTKVHFFYDSMCGECADFNYKKRSQTADLSGRVALITGARVKIGYQAAIMLLRAGARVVVTTRFPRDAASRYAKEEDFGQWGARLQIHGLDLRHTPSVDAFTRYLNASLDRLDFIVSNACQTVRRPSGFYGHLMDAEKLPYASLPTHARTLLTAYETARDQAAATKLPAVMGQPKSVVSAVGLQDPAALSQVALLHEDLEHGPHLFPTAQLDADLQQIDLRDRNSWRLPMADVSAVELLEVHLVNAIAPFVLNARLKSLMARDGSPDKHIVNVSAMEGQFYRTFKTDKHPHTNMAKAALNMMTRTSAADYIHDGIHMNSVDTGWVTDEDPAEIAARKKAEGFHPPLDIVDGAARICDPIFSGFLTGHHVWGEFLKDYAPTHW